MELAWYDIDPHLMLHTHTQLFKFMLYYIEKNLNELYRLWLCNNDRKIKTFSLSQF